MQYALLIYIEEPDADTSFDEQMGDTIGGYDRFTQHVRETGAYLAGEALHPTSTATTVRIRDGQTLTTDGPFAETKEALGGFYLVEAPDLDAAIELAAMIPGAHFGCVEVRPVYDFSALPREDAATAAAG